MIRFGQFDMDTRCGVTLTNRTEGRSLFFQPGDDAGNFHDRLDAMSAADPDAPYERHLAALWDEYKELAA